ncbi:MAG TPA: MFS transporter, partial [Jatrophihabitantaceae bacterium]|nr:MFS transporter [Jatrophihabitantaceae bacterium]
MPESPNPGAGRVLALMCGGMFLVLLDVTIVNVALPDIQRGLHTDVAGLQWVVDGYAVAIASLLLAAGTIGDRHGHRRVLLLGFTVFGAASLACAVAPTVGVLIAARVAQGVGGALLLPSTMAIIADAYPDRAEQARAIGIWAAASSLALPAGPLLGGLLVDSIGWRVIFWINVPLVVAIVVAALRMVPHAPGRGSGRFDRVGVLCFAATVAGVVFTVIAIGHGEPAPVWIATAVVTVLAAVLGARQERRVEHPVLPWQLLRRRAFSYPNAVAFTMNCVFNGTLFVGMLYLQRIRHDSPLLAGALVLPMAIPLVALAPVSARITAARGPRTAITTGCLVAAAGSLAIAGQSVSGTLVWFVSGLALMGLGAGLVTASVVAAVVRATPADRSGLATGMSNTSRQIGTATGVALFGAVAGSTAKAADFVGAMH